MNKYIEAFDTIECRCHTDDEVCNCNKATKDKMCLECDVDKDLQTLRELVEKATTKKPVIFSIDGFDPEVVGHKRCPNCDQPIMNVWRAYYKPNYCHYCGQKLDWSNENE